MTALARVHQLAAAVAEGRGPVRFLSVCSGIEAASCALEPIGFTSVGFAEIDKAASALLARRFPHIRNFGDFTAIDPVEVGPVDWLIGGTPCQAFSIAGKRLSLADARGNLTLAYAVLAHELARSNGLRGALWENVPGVLNTPDNAFGCFLAALVGSERALVQPRGTGWPNAGMVDGPWARAAWIVRDAQYFGLAQRRERVFVVVGFGDRVDPAQILFERASLPGNSAPRREARERVARPLASSPRGGSGYRNDADTADNLIAASPVAGSLNCSVARGTGQANETDFLITETVGALSSNGGTERKHGYGMGQQDYEAGYAIPVAHTLRGEGFDASEDGTGRGTPIVPVRTGYQGDSLVTPDGVWPALSAQGGNNGGGPGAILIAPGPPVAFDARQADVHGDLMNSMRARGGSSDIPAGSAQFEGPHDTANIRSASGGSSRSYIAQVELQNQGSGGNRGYADIEEPAFTLNTNGPSGVVDSRWAVRRLLPIECERLQGFPDGWTEGQADGPRYRQLGNSMAVPCIRWLGERILASLPQMPRHSWSEPSRPSELRTERTCIRCRIVRVTRHDRGPSAIPWVEYYEPGGPLVDGGVLWQTPDCEPAATGVGA